MIVIVLNKYRPGQTLRVTRVWGFRDSWTINTWGGKLSQPYAPATFTPRRYSCNSSQGHRAAGVLKSIKNLVILWKICVDIGSSYLRYKVIVEDVHFTVIYVMNEVSDYGLSGRDHVSLGKWFPTFRRNVSTSFSSSMRIGSRSGDRNSRLHRSENMEYRRLSKSNVTLVIGNGVCNT
jgi:hypothetical protein